MKYANWGLFPTIEGQEVFLKETESISALIHTLQQEKSSKNWIPRGMGRSYGDSSLADVMVSSLKCNHFLSFDTQTGVLVCESGVTFADILHVFTPKGWFPPVTPGTKFVSMGGAIASDVHGKNHHSEGCFSDHVLWIEICLPNGTIQTCSSTENRTLFLATVGGMGMTGFITKLALRLKKISSVYIHTQSVKAANLSEILTLLHEFDNATYTMAWIDCLSTGNQLGRSIMMKGEHAPAESLSLENPLHSPLKRKLNVPVFFPNWALNTLSVRAFNFAYYHKQFQKEKQITQHFDSFFYPLDAIHNWNRIYGKNGFTQYQFVIPKAAGYEGMKRIITAIAQSGLGSFLAVLKTFGKENDAFLSFPTEGYTLALDFPITHTVFTLLDTLDEMVMSYGGRVYLTKDARLSPHNFSRMYPQWENQQAVLNTLGTHNLLSTQFRRLMAFL